MTLKLLLLLFLSSFFFACSEEPPIPKPKTYLLLETTQPIYSQIDDKNLPFTFAIPDYGKIAMLNSEQKDI